MSGWNAQIRTVTVEGQEFRLWIEPTRWHIKVYAPIPPHEELPFDDDYAYQIGSDADRETLARIEYPPDAERLIAAVIADYLRDREAARRVGGIREALRHDGTLDATINGRD